MQHISFTIARLANKGGTERMATSLANALNERGYKVSLISVQPFDKPFFEVDTRIKTFQLFSEDTDKRKGVVSKVKVYPEIISSLNKVVKENKIDVIIDVDVDLSFFTLTLKLWNSKIKVISWEHFHYKENLGLRRRGWARQLAKKYADAIVVLTEQDKLAYEEDGKTNTQISVISNFLDYVPQQQAELKAKKVLAIGNLIPVKGFDMLIKSWAGVKKRDCSDGWILQIVGDGTEKNNLIQQAEELRVSDSVKFIAPTTEIWNYYLNSSIFVLSSRYEGFGLVLLEAESAGLPSVVFDCPMGPREIVIDGEDSFLIPANDEAEMTKKICLLMQNDSLRKVMGAKAKENAKRFAKESIVDEWVNLIKSL